MNSDEEKEGKSLFSIIGDLAEEKFNLGVLFTKNIFRKRYPKIKKEKIKISNKQMKAKQKPNHKKYPDKICTKGNYSGR